MSRLTISTAIACLLLLFLFWLTIEIGGGNAPWLQIGATETSASTPLVEPATNPPALTCEESEITLRDRVDSARQCSVDSDCTLVDFGYPIDCMTSVAMAEVTDLRLEYRRYDESCDFRVYFDCPAEPMVRRAVCQQNRCSVSLETTDGLEKETLDYLGIGSTDSNSDR